MAQLKSTIINGDLSVTEKINGALNTTTVATGDFLVITDTSDTKKIRESNISFNASNTTVWLTQAGTWTAPGPTDVGLGSVSNNSNLNGATGSVGDMIYWSAANTPARLTKGNSGTVLRMGSSNIPIWQDVYTNTSGLTENLGLGTNNDYLVTKNALAYWDGRYTNNASNLAYCNQGAFSDIVTKATTEFLSTSTGGTVGTSGTITISNTSDIAGNSFVTPPLVIGTSTGTHLELSKSSIMAKATNTTTSPLYLNTDGGLVYIGSGGAYFNNATTYFKVPTAKNTANISDISHILAFQDNTGSTETAKKFAMIKAKYASSASCTQLILATYAYNRDSTEQDSERAFFLLECKTEGSITTNRTRGNVKIYGAVWNDYAEYRKQKEKIKPGYVVKDNDDGRVSLTDKRLIPGAQVVSDTFGFALGETDECQTPLAVSGRVLVYTYRDRYEYHAGMSVCSAPNGTVDIMAREEIQKYPDAIVGIVSEIPEYEEWGQDSIKVNNRIWIKVK